MPKLIKEIESDAHFPDAAKVILTTSLPRLAAKWLNKSGLSAEYQDEIAVITAILLIYQHDRKMMLKLDKLIAQTKPKEPKKNPEQPIFGQPSATASSGKREAETPAPAHTPSPEIQPIATVKQ